MTLRCHDPALPHRRHHAGAPLYSAGVRRFSVVPVLAAVGLAVSAVVAGLAPAHADGLGSGRALATDQPRAEAEQYTIMGDSHVVVMMDALYPGAYTNGAEGTLIDGKFVVYGLHGIKLQQVVNGRGLVKAGERAVGTTNVSRWKKALRTGPDTIVVNLGTNDGGPKAWDIDRFMRLAGKDRRVFWVEPYYTSCPACRALHDYELKAAAKRFSNFHIIKTRDLGLVLASDGLHAFGRANSQALWDRIMEEILPIPSPQPVPSQP
ncbi:MAG: hypothetical protein RL134_396 [Actinomycetota bacterium]